jgi:glycosyltransferase involved in cell wall biosynthesis
MNKLPICVLLPTKNRPEYCAQTLQSLWHQTELPSKVFIYDQSDTTSFASPLFRKAYELLSMSTEVCYRYDRANFQNRLQLRIYLNSYIEQPIQPDYPYVYWLDDDVILHYRALEAVYQIIKTRPCGVVANALFDIDLENVRLPADGLPHHETSRWRYFRDSDQKIRPLMWAQGSCLLFDSKCLLDIQRDIYHFPHFPARGQEDILFLYLTKKKYGGWITCDPMCWHLAPLSIDNVEDSSNYEEFVRYCENNGLMGLLESRKAAPHPAFWFWKVENPERQTV